MPFIQQGEKMNKIQETFMRIREYIRKNPKTNWGKNQLIDALDKMEKSIIDGGEKS